ncbi:MAG: DsbA family protein [Halobacteriota archaeon]
MEHSTLGRRRLLALGAAGLVGVAGCLGGQPGASDGGSMGGEGNDEGGDGGAEGGESTASSDATTLANHPAAVDLDAQPRLGPDPTSAAATIIAFEDPSCTRCAAFERDTVPRITSELVDPGVGAFVVRTYPVIYPWGEPAVQALEATYARDADAFWGLLDHYFADQSSFDADNVLTKTGEWLAANTDLDADAIVSDAENEAYDDLVQADLDAGQAAGAGGTTPSVFLFRDGEYRTKAAGSVSWELIQNALEL